MRGISDKGLTRIFRKMAQSDPGVSLHPNKVLDEDSLEEAEYATESGSEDIDTETAKKKLENYVDESTILHMYDARGWISGDHTSWWVSGDVFVPEKDVMDFLNFYETPTEEDIKDALYEAYEDSHYGGPGRWSSSLSVYKVSHEKDGWRFTVQYEASMDI